MECRDCRGAYSATRTRWCFVVLRHLSKDGRDAGSLIDQRPLTPPGPQWRGIIFYLQKPFRVRQVTCKLSFGNSTTLDRPWNLGIPMCPNTTTTLQGGTDQSCSMQYLITQCDAVLMTFGTYLPKVHVPKVGRSLESLKTNRTEGTVSGLEPLASLTGQCVRAGVLCELTKTDVIQRACIYLPGILVDNSWCHGEADRCVTGIS